MCSPIATLTPAQLYDAAYMRYREAFRLFNAARLAFRAGSITDGAYIQARQAFARVEADFDSAEAELLSSQNCELAHRS